MAHLKIICITESRDERILHLGNVSLDYAIEAVRYLRKCNPSKQFILKTPE